jgi:hypothetical protein
MFRTILGSDQANSVKNTEINKQLHVKFWFNIKEYGAVSYLLSCMYMSHAVSYLNSLLVQWTTCTFGPAQI